MRKQIAAANWKMNCTLQQSTALLDELLATPHETDANHVAVFGVPFPYLMLAKEKIGRQSKCVCSGTKLLQ